MPFSTPSVLRFFNFISFNRENDTKDVCRIDEPHRGSAFDSPGLASIASYPGLICCVGAQRHRCCASLIFSTGILNTNYKHIHIQRKRNTDGVAHSHTFVGRVTRFARQPCPIKNGTPVGFTLLLNHIRYEITETISEETSLSKGRVAQRDNFSLGRRTP